MNTTRRMKAIGFLAVGPFIMGLLLSGCGLFSTSASPSLGIGSTLVSDQDGMTLVYVPKGDFLMGLTDAEGSQLGKEMDCPLCGSDTTPQHTVYLDAYWIDKTEVTNAMFAKFVAATNHKSDAEKNGFGYVVDFSDGWYKDVKGADWQHPRGPNSDIIGLENHPVVQVAWDDAKAYCEWAGLRLPTEAEWEKAARGTHGQKYPWGDAPVAGNLLNFADKNLNVSYADKTIDDGYEFTAPVGHYPAGASPYGALDMAGNVVEWTADWFGESYYANSPLENPTGPTSGSWRILRGGSWAWKATSPAFRGTMGPDITNDEYGFRCTRSASAPTPTAKEKSNKDFPITNFDAVHSPVNNDGNTYLIFGNIPVSSPAQDLAPELAVFLGRWEGYDYSPPVKKDYKIVLVIQDITAQGGKAYLWLGTNLQYPSSVQEIKFKTIPGNISIIEFDASFGGSTETIQLTYDPDKKLLQSPDNAHRPLELSRDQSFYVYKDYSQYLAGKRISSKAYQNKDLPQYGNGYLLYLPEGYEDNPTKTWPLIFFLHGAGDRGDNVYLLAKASPCMYIREKGPLPFIIIAPLLNGSQNAFPIEYLDGVLAEAQATYRVDPKRIYVTGLSLGGEATYRFAIHQPEAFAAIAPLSAWLDSDQISLLNQIKNLPVWAIHGADDTIVPLARGQQPVDALKKLGGNIRFTVLERHDHDTWTDTYLDPTFYDWFLQYRRP